MRFLASLLCLACACKIRIEHDVPAADAAPPDVEVSIDAPMSYLKAEAIRAAEHFGYAVAVSADGSTLAIGAPSAPSVTVYVRADRGWALQRTLREPSFEFGRAVALSADGSTLVVGAVGDVGDRGAAVVFVRTGSVWAPQARLVASNAENSDRFSAAVAISGDGSMIAIGAPGESSAARGIDGDQTSNAARYAGAVYVFGRSGTSWTQKAYIKASNADAYDGFGARVALAADASVLAVGAPGEASSTRLIDGLQDDNGAPSAGAVYIFVRPTGGGSWTQSRYLKASNADAGDRFGEVVALAASGSMLVVTAPGEASSARGVDGDEADNSASQAGAAYVFTRQFIMQQWTQAAYLKASNTQALADERFGGAAAIANDGIIAIGAFAEASNALGIDGDQSNNDAPGAGAVYVYRGTGFGQITYVKATNTGADDHFGTSVALPLDGSFVVVGAPFEDGSTPEGMVENNFAENAGAAYVMVLP